MITANEFGKIEEIVRQAVGPIKTDLKDVKVDLDSLRGSVDTFVHANEQHEQELKILRGQQKKMRIALVKKGIASDDELSIVG